MNKPKVLISINEKNEMKIDSETAKALAEVNAPIDVIAIVGPSRTGKSYIANRLASKQKGFPVGNTVEGTTKGMWIWIVDHPKQPNKKLVLLDTEGTGYASKTENKMDANIFTLSLLLSSKIIYNTKCCIDTQCLERLHFMANLSDYLKVRASNDAATDCFYELMLPDLIWVIRDMELDLTKNGKNISSNEYLEDCLNDKQGNPFNNVRRSLRRYFPSRKCFTFARPAEKNETIQKLEMSPQGKVSKLFVEQMRSFCDDVLTQCKDKTVGMGQKVNGRMVLGMAECFIAAINKGSIPCIQTTVERVSNTENKKALEEAIDYYQRNMNVKLKGPVNKNALSILHDWFSSEAYQRFTSNTIFITSDEHLLEFEKRIVEVYSKLVSCNEERNRRECAEILNDLYLPLKDSIAAGTFQVPGGYQNFLQKLNLLQVKYSKATSGFDQAAAVYQYFLSKLQGHSEAILQFDKQLSKFDRKRIDVERKRKENERRIEKAEQEKQNIQSETEYFHKCFEKRQEMLERTYRKHLDYLQKYHNDYSDKLIKLRFQQDNQSRDSEIEELEKKVANLEELLSKSKKKKRFMSPKSKEMAFEVAKDVFVAAIPIALTALTGLPIFV